MEWSYFKEGNANVLYIDKSKRKLLRLTKKNNHNTAAQIHENLNHFSRFLKYLPHTEFIQIDVRYWQGINPSIKADSGALLMDNLVYGMVHVVDNDNKHVRLYLNEDHNKAILEFKPKWLYACETKNCRNCCLDKLKNRKQTCCPLMLLNDTAILNWVAETFSNFKVNVKDDWIQVKLTESLVKDDILRMLYEEQRSKPSIHTELLNLSCPADVTSALQRRMTLRDVTLFISVQQDSDEYAIHMVDLDLKPKAKFDYWRDLELQLQALYNADIGIKCAGKVTQ